MTSGVKFSPEQIAKFKAKVLDLMREGNNITFRDACAAANWSSFPAYQQRRIDPEWDAEVRAARQLSIDNGLDFAENRLMQNIEQGREPSIFFYLRTIGKHRGFVERTEQTGADGTPLSPPSVNVLFPNLKQFRETPTDDSSDPG